MLRILLSVAAAALLVLAVPTPASADDDWDVSVRFGSRPHYRSDYQYYRPYVPRYYGYGHHGSGYYHTYPSYRTYGYSPAHDYYGSREYGAGRHARGLSYPGRYDLHHGYHWNPRGGWHGGTHFDEH